MSAADILKCSVVNITNTRSYGENNDNSVYDQRMGPVDSSICKTCGLSAMECIGHFGHIELPSLFVIPLTFYQEILLHIMGIFCFKCSSNLLVPFGSVTKKRSQSILSIVYSRTKGKTCSKCNHKNRQVFIKDGFMMYEDNTLVDTEECLEFLKKLDTDHLTKMEINTKFAHPQNYLIKYLPVLPPMNRPFIMQGKQICDDDLTTLYIDIVKNINKLKTKHESDGMKFMKKIAYNIQTLFNNSKGNARHPSSGRPLNSLMQRLSGKDGLIRNNCMGKRCDHNARAVASPDSSLDLHEIGLPEIFTKILTIPVKCTDENLKELQSLCDSNKVSRIVRIINEEEHEFGVAKFCNQVQTKLLRGDIIRKPSEMMPIDIKVETGHEILEEGDVIIRNGKEIKTKCATFRRFLIEIGDVVSRYITNGDVVLLNRQPTLHVGSIVALTVKLHSDFTIKIPLGITPRINADFDGDELNIHVPQTDEAIEELKNVAHVTKNMVSPSTQTPYTMIVQDGLLGLYLMTVESVLVNDDFVTPEFDRIKNVRTKLGIDHVNDTFALVSSCLHPELIIDHKDFQIICGVWINGIITKNIINYIINIIVYNFGSEQACKIISNIQRTATLWLTRRGFTLSGKDVNFIHKYEDVYNYTKKMFEMGYHESHIRDSLHTEAFEKHKNGNILKLVASGVKGTFIDMGQLIASIGAQRTSNYVEKPFSTFDEFIKSGYVPECFAHGLSANSFFAHAQPSRENITNSIIGIPCVGYTQHRLTKLHEDLITLNNSIIYNGTSRKLIQVVYNDGKNIWFPECDQDYLTTINKLIKNG